MVDEDPRGPQKVPRTASAFPGKEEAKACGESRVRQGQRLEQQEGRQSECRR